ncbi:nucleoside hydrolase-like domain-containing protein [Arundinibacter roseus]|uniref:DUF1593 domain-containing protein n=1 Tax=Arundinibacter roseus TaxID=2070510 RepID=A0A4R4JXL3_9BACT|nr:nucleoside hydrolase-like domain-containing protein [Arundinibacter roseus]TDB59518.1 DUF1593 domain-containing protein [Arundinibacter roseus]
MKRLFLLVMLIVWHFQCPAQTTKHRVFVFTDINIGGGDPDDRQSLVHLFWYADELEIVGIVPDRWNKQGMDACQMAIDAFRKDYDKYKFVSFGFPDAKKLEELLAKNTADAIERLRKAAVESNEQPLYVLVWGNMANFGKALKQYPEISEKIRLITIGTGLKYGPKDEVAGEECNVPNWNGDGRNEIYNDPRFNKMWWLEINWTYNGMFSGEGPKEMFKQLSKFGAMGEHIEFVTRDHPWAQYFRVGDTPSVLYLLDPSHNPDDPTLSSWAGKFKKPFEQERPNYYTDDNGTIPWNYTDPCASWNQVKAMYVYNKQTLENERPGMYKALIKKLVKIYGKN